MTKQEQIENMIGVMSASNNPFVDVPIEIMPQVAKALYNAGYRKIDEVRKETAKEIFKAIIKALEMKKASIMTHYGVKESVGADVAIRTVKELAKQLGVEIKEC